MDRLQEEDSEEAFEGGGEGEVAMLQGLVRILRRVLRETGRRRTRAAGLIIIGGISVRGKWREVDLLAD